MHNPKMKPAPLSRRWLNRMIVGSAAGVVALNQSVRAEQRNRMFRASECEAQDYWAIAQLTYRYGMAVDTLDAAAFRSCFTPDAVMWGKGARFEGDFAEKIIEGHRTATQCTMHLALNHSYQVQGLTATGVMYGIAVSIVKAGEKLNKVEHYMRYDDELVKQHGCWLFRKRQLDVLFMTEAPVASFDADLARRRSADRP